MGELAGYQSQDVINDLSGKPETTHQLPPLPIVGYTNQMFRMSDKLQDWVQAELITAAQASSILDYERQAKSGRPWVLYGLVAIGVAAIAIGMVSVVAANWDQIPGFIKLACYALLHSALGVGLYKLMDKPGAAREGALILFALMFFAGIGLTAQVFHIRSDGWSGLLFWCALALPAVMYARTRALHYLWIAVLLIAEFIWLESHMRPRLEDLQQLLSFAFVTLSVYGYFSIGVLQGQRLQLPRHFSEAMRVVPLLLIVVGGSIVGTLIWYKGFENGVPRTGRRAAFYYPLQYTPWIGASIASAALLLGQRRYEKKLAGALAAVFFGLAAFVSLPLLLSLGEHKIIGTLLCIGIWWIAAIAAVYAGRKRLFDAITLLITLRLLLVYFEVFGSMMATGIGLILSGILVLVVAWAWYRFRGKFAAWLKTN